MHPYPHVYSVSASGSATGVVPLAASGLPVIDTAPPPEFDGPGGLWSPETLLVAAVANCFILTFRGVARAARLEWERIECQVEGVLERTDGVTSFSRFRTRATLQLAPGIDRGKARELLERAEHLCLIANSLRGARELETVIP